MEPPIVNLEVTIPSHVETPMALIDEPRMRHNIAMMQARINDLGVAFRPHVKTSKSIDVAWRQREAGARGLTVSTLKEAESFFEAGFDDILYAVCIAPAKLGHVRRLRDAGCRLTIIVDSTEAATAVVAAGRDSAHVFDVMIEIDTDGHRSGVLPESDLLLRVGHTLHAGGMSLRGVMTHAGSSYGCDTPQALRAIAEQERSLCVRAAERMRDAGLPCPVVSVGSTPTALSAEHLRGVTEVRAGVYVFFDLVMAGVGVCTPEQIALSVLTTVIGHQPDKGWIIVDAGWMAMSRDRGTQSQRVDQGYGLVCDLQGNVLGDLIVSGANQEHGIISRRESLPADPTLAERFPVGTLLRLLPNHACATAAQFPSYQVLPGWMTWPRLHGW